MAAITIVTPTYNRAHTLERSFNALKKQSFKDFKWIIMDDGSTDDTRHLVARFQNENIFDIDYYYNDNQHKFITVFKGIEKVSTPYFMVLDSDDSYPSDALQILFDESESIKNQEDFIGIIGHSADKDGQIVGDVFPEEFDGSIFEMRYKHKVRGDKNGIFFTKTYQQLLSHFNYQQYQGKGYIPQSVFFNTYDAEGVKTRFINKIVRNYFMDLEDQHSVSNTRWSRKNTFGLMEGHLSFLNAYGGQLWRYPKALIRNLVSYQAYARVNNKGLIDINKRLKSFKMLSVFLYPLSLLYLKIKK